MSPKLSSTLLWTLLAASAGCQGAVDEYLKLADMEPNSDTMPVGCSMVWIYSTYQGSQTKYIHPTASEQQFAELPTSRATMPGVLSQYAAHLWTEQPLDTTPEDTAGQAPADRLWGANTGVDLGQATPSQCPLTAADNSADGGAARWPLDLSNYTGLVFWAKAATTQYAWPADASAAKHTMAHRIRVLVRDKYSDDSGGICTTSTAIEETANKCWNAFSVTLDLTETFARYAVDFASMWRDSTWGATPSPYKLDQQHVYSIAFEVSAPKCVADQNAACVQEYPALAFDLWIDDLYLVKHTP